MDTTKNMPLFNSRGDPVKVDAIDYAAVYAEIERRGSVRDYEFVQLCGRRGMNNSASVLTAFERRGYLLSEDDRGRLYPFRRCDENL
jgi:hypothetical protein